MTGHAMLGIPETATTPMGLLEHVEIRRLEASNRLADDAERRGQLGQFLTPMSIASFMASMIEPVEGETIRILDAGGGSGALTAAAVSAICTWPSPPQEITATTWEIDATLADDLRATMALCESACDHAGVAFLPDVRHHDFIRDGVESLSGARLFGNGSANFDLAILNPPYRKLASDTAERTLLGSVGIETSNLYAAFVWLAIEMLAPCGQLVAITPRSYMNGTYFRPFRRRLADAMSIRRVHVYDSRTSAFGGDDVLQENAIIHAIKGARGEPVDITTSGGPDDPGMTSRTVRSDRLILPDDRECVMHVVPDELDAQIADIMRGLPCSLADLGVAASTGRVVDFRSRPRLHETRGPADAPLIFPRHLRNGTIEWPRLTGGKPNAIASNDPADPLLLPSGWYVLVKRFSAKEERRRVVAVPYDPRAIEADRVGFDNKLNVLHREHHGLPTDLARGLAVFLNSTMVDAYFRQFSGHTQVNAGDLRSLRFPLARELERLGSSITEPMPSQGVIDALIQEEILSMAKADDPVAAKQKIAEAIAVLKAIKAPPAQQNERSALTLLGLLDLKRDTAWSEAAASLCGVSPLMAWMAEHYGKQYAPNTRETIRRHSLHQFIEMGLVVINPDKPNRPTNSPQSVYQIEPSALALVQTHGTKDWPGVLDAYLRSIGSSNRLRVRSRTMDRIAVTLPGGAKVNLSAGGQNVLIKDIIEAFAPRFTPGGRVLYLGDAGEKHLVNDTAYLAELGIEIDPHGKMPDVVIHHTQRDWLVLIEAVTSHGPVDITRHNQLRGLFASCRCGMVFVTAFLDRRAMRDYLPEIAWETEVWVADAPDHLIHFNGERFLGPYAQRDE